MKLTIRGLSFRPTEAIREHAQRRFESALARHARSVRDIEVVLKDINGPRGGRDQLCRVRVGLAGGGAVHLSKQGHDAYDNISEMAGAVKRAVTRHLDRARCRRP